jgi:predicted PurR-regulated permease PerM
MNKMKNLLTNPHIQQGFITGVTVAAGAATIVQVFDSQLVDTVKDLNETVSKESQAIQQELKDLKVSNKESAEKIINNQNKLMEELKKQQFKSNSSNVTSDDVNRSIGIIDGILRIFVNVKSLFTVGNKKSPENNFGDVSGHRDPSDQGFSTPPSGKAHRDRQR